MTRSVRFVGAIVLGLSFVCTAMAAEDQQPSEKRAPEQASQKVAPVRPSRFWRGAPPDLLPDLIITTATVTMKCKPGGFKEATMVATVKNAGSTATADLSAIPWQLIIAADWYPNWSAGNPPTSPPTWVKPLAGGPMSLKPGEEWTATMVMPGLPKLNTQSDNLEIYDFTLDADPLEQVAESNETNNNFWARVALDNCVPVDY
jgi:CARDB